MIRGSPLFRPHSALKHSLHSTPALLPCVYVRHRQTAAFAESLQAMLIASASAATAAAVHLLCKPSAKRKLHLQTLVPSRPFLASLTYDLKKCSLTTDR